jgi:serine/threonine protein kinase
LEPENIGFDIRGDVKIFDFGLCKSLDPKQKAKGRYGYHLTARTGSMPYMAPEICKGEPYDTEADVFSFAILLWEILSLQWAFNGCSLKEYYKRVALHHERLPITSSWPVIVRTILVEAWDKDPQKRPSMKRIGTLIRADLQDLSEDDNVVNRTEHMMNRSKRSFRLGTGSSLKSSHDVKNSPIGGGSNNHMLEEANAVRLESEQKTGTVAEVGEVVRNRNERS